MFPPNASTEVRSCFVFSFLHSPALNFFLSSLSFISKNFYSYFCCSTIHHFIHLGRLTVSPLFVFFWYHIQWEAELQSERNAYREAEFLYCQHCETFLDFSVTILKHKAFGVFYNFWRMLWLNMHTHSKPGEYFWVPRLIKVFQKSYFTIKISEVLHCLFFFNTISFFFFKHHMRRHFLGPSASKINNSRCIFQMPS